MLIPTLVKTRIQRLRQPLEEIREFEAAIEKCTDWRVVRGLPGLPLAMLKVVARIVRLFGLVLDRVSRTVVTKPQANYLCIGYSAPHYLIYKSFPYLCLPAHTRMVWLYDAWENKLDEIEQTFRTYRINIAFVTSRQATEHFNSRGIERFAAYWMPEAVSIEEYPAKPASERHIDVLQMGRRWDQYHDAIAEFCRREGLAYLYERKPGDIIFATRSEFLDALASSKISICVPSSVTHPGRSGKIATMTWRYLQSMASKCLVVGRMPEEMKELFDYNPMIEIDLSDPTGQLRELLANYTDYSPLIERNHQFIKTYHGWDNRIDRIRIGLEDFERRFPAGD